MDEAAQALGRHRVQQERKEQHRHADGREADEAEAALGSVTAAQALMICSGATHIAPDTGARCAAR